jgi:hypothetical protein
LSRLVTCNAMAGGVAVGPPLGGSVCTRRLSSLALVLRLWSGAASAMWWLVVRSADSPSTTRTGTSVSSTRGKALVCRWQRFGTARPRISDSGSCGRVHMGGVSKYMHDAHVRSHLAQQTARSVSTRRAALHQKGPVRGPGGRRPAVVRTASGGSDKISRVSVSERLGSDMISLSGPGGSLNPFTGYGPKTLGSQPTPA